MEHITVDGVQHEVSKFSDEVKGLINTFVKLSAQKDDATVELYKCERALEHLNGVLADKIKNELDPKDPA